ALAPFVGASTVTLSIMAGPTLRFLEQALPARAALASEASGQRDQPKSARAGHSPEPGSSARAALASEASGQRGQPKSARAGHSPEPGASARAAGVRAMPDPPAAVGRCLTVAAAKPR